LEWTASGYVGPIGTGQSFTRTLSAGDHLIVMLARDTTLARAATVRISVREAPEGYRPGTPSRFNFPPTVRISAPPDQGDVFVPSGGCITLRAFATDIEDGTEPFHRMTSPNAISWEETVRVLGPPGQTRPLGKGESLEMCRPSLGSHDVTARVTDSGGATASDSIHFVVQRIP